MKRITIDKVLEELMSLDEEWGNMPMKDLKEITKVVNKLRSDN